VQVPQNTVPLLRSVTSSEIYSSILTTVVNGEEPNG